MDVEDPAPAGDHLDDDAVVLHLLENARHQTGGVRPRGSGNAVLDPDRVRVRHHRDSITRMTLLADPPSGGAP